MEYHKEDVRTGAFIIVGLVLFFASIFWVGGLADNFKDRFEITLEFDNAELVKAGTEVYFLGKQVGKVTEVKYADREQKVLISCSVDTSAKIKTSYVAQISDKSALGGKIIEIISTDSDPNASAVTNGSTLHGRDAQGLKALITKLDQISGQINDVVADIRGPIKNILEHVEKTSVDFEEIVKQTKEMLNDNKDKFNEIVENIRAASDKADQALDKIDKLIADNRENMNKIIENVEDVSKTLRDDVKSVMEKTVALLESGKSLASNADQMLNENYHNIAESLAALSVTLRNLQHFTAKIAEQPSAIIWGTSDKSPAKTLTDEERWDMDLQNSGQAGRIGKDK